MCTLVFYFYNHVIELLLQYIYIYIYIYNYNIVALINNVNE